MQTQRRAALLCAGLLALLAAARSAPPLPALGADLSQTTVSGLSSGAFMAEQFAVIHSAIVTGAGLIAGGPYYCAGHPGREPFIPYLSNAMSVCMNPLDAATDPPDALFLWNRTRDFARAGLIDDIGNLRRQSIYLFSGKSDRTVTTVVVDQARNFHDLAGAHMLRYRDDIDAGHGMVTDSGDDQACAVTAPPYFNNCKLPVARDILNFLYPGLLPPAARQSGSIVRFDQRRYGPQRASLGDDGYVYVPRDCRQGGCRVHVAFHGCRQGVDFVGDRFYVHAGYNRVADSNRIIVLYPQVEANPFYPYNPRGCWDYWGYSSRDPFAPDFYTRNGVQVRAVRAMLERLAQPKGTVLR